MNTTATSLKNRIYTSIFNGIILGEYDPDQVINEKGLMEKFHVSRAPIREALIELCNEKVLYSIPYYGYKITPLTDEDVANVKSYRCVTECGFMRANWQKLTPEAIDNLENLYIKNTVAENDAITHWNENIDFHLAFFDLYGNHYAYENLRSAMSLQTRAYALTRWNEWHSKLFEDVPTFHQPILTAIRANDPDKATDLLYSDIISI